MRMENQSMIRKNSPIICFLILLFINIPTKIYAFYGLYKNNITTWQIIILLIAILLLIPQKSRSTVIGVMIGLGIFYLTAQYVRLVLDI